MYIIKDALGYRGGGGWLRAGQYSIQKKKKKG